VPLKHGAEARAHFDNPQLQRVVFGSILLIFAHLVALGCGQPPEPGADRRAITVLLPREPDQLDPRFVGDAYGLKLSRLLHASLVRINSQTLEPEPYLAEQTIIEAPTRYRVVLRPNLRFSDGTRLDAEDVVATFRALADPKVRSRYASTYRRIRDVRSAGPLQVVFELNAPHATFLTDLEIPVLRAEDAFQPAAPERVQRGAGPYQLIERGRGTLILHANPNYFAGPVAHPKLRFIVVRDDNTRALRMLAGAGDLALNTLPPLLLPLFKSPRFQVRTAPGVGTSYVGLNLEHPAFRDVRVRLALAYALDRAALIRHKLAGHARLASSWIVPGHWAHAADTPSHPFDPSRAQTLLREAGYGGARAPLSFTLRTSSDRSAVSTARAMAAMWQSVGVEVEVRPSETATMLADLARGRFDASYLQVPEVLEPHVLSWFFGSDHIPEPGRREGGNRWRIRDPELDRLLEAGRTTIERARRAHIYREVQHLLARELPIIPLWHEDVVAVTSGRLDDYVVPRDARFGSLAVH
jgi:peptide/nickel transport system substrate-binding protein